MPPAGDTSPAAWRLEPNVRRSDHVFLESRGADRSQARGRSCGRPVRVGLGRVVLCCFVDAEIGHSAIHGLRLVFKCFRGRGVLFDEGRVLLGHLVHLRQRPVDLIDAGRLLDACRRDVGDDLGDLLDRLDDSGERQQIGLPGDLVDDTDNIGDLDRGFLDAAMAATALATT